MKEILRWYSNTLDKDKLNKFFRLTGIEIPGFRKKVDKAPVQIMRKKFSGVCIDVPRDRLMSFLSILNEELYDEINELSIAEIMAEEIELIGKYNLPDYVLGLLAMSEMEDFDHINEHINQLIIDVDQQENQIDDVDAKETLVDINATTEKESKILRKKLKDKTQQLEQATNQIQKLNSTITRIKEKNKKQLGDMAKAYERTNTELEEAITSQNEALNRKRKLEVQLGEMNNAINQLTTENEGLKKKLAEQEVLLNIWQAKHPGEKLNNKTLRVIFLGDKSNRVINVVSGVVVDKTCVDFDDVDVICSSEDHIKEYDVAFLLSSRCTFEQRRKILKNFNSCQIKINEIPNIKSSEDIINQLITDLSKDKRRAI